jgi:predicted Zn-dependent peptidase
MMMKKTKLSLLLASCVVAGTWLISPGSATFAAEFKSPLIPVTKDFKLPNGLRVIFSVDHSTPVAALAIVYDVGARNEKKGRSGFAHLFEHMMFEGSENVGKTEHFKYIESAGGSLNASTHPDFTNYFEKLPSNQIELALWLESDRMRSLKVTPENFENQLQTVKEEKRSRIDNQPYVPASIKMEELLFDNWANAHPTIGTFDDLEASSIDDIRHFFHTYYAPNNAVMAIVGDFDANEMEKLVRKYFASIPSQPLPGKPDVVEPAQTKGKYLKVADQHAKAPAFWVSWKAPARREPDYYALGIIQKLLSAGDSSRLFQRMVKGDQNALKIDVGYDERRGPSALETFVVVKPGFTPEQVRETLWSELEKLKTTPVSGEELEKAKNQILHDLFASSSYESLQRSLGRAELLAEYACFFGDPSLIDKDLEAYMNVSAADVQRVAAKVLTKSGATIVDVYPQEAEKPKQTAEAEK